MCRPKLPEVKNILPTAPKPPEEPPEPISVDKDGKDRAKRRRNPLRIDLARGSGGNGRQSGVNV